MKNVVSSCVESSLIGSVFQAVAEDYGLDPDAPPHSQAFARIEFATLFEHAAEIDRREGNAPIIPLIFASGERAAVWDSICISPRALALICEKPCHNGPKSLRGISLCSVPGSARGKYHVTAVTGLALDDDGVIGKTKILAALNAPGAPLTIAFATASNSCEETHQTHSGT